MSSGLPNADDVLHDLGDKFIKGFVASVEEAKEDLARFRSWRPEWFPSFSSRFVANFIHERMWAGMVTRMEDHPDVTITDKEPRRELGHSGKYIVRLKRHLPGDRIRTFPTTGALKFWSGGVVLPGMEVTSLALGYMWNAEERKMGAAVMSYRDHIDRPVWAVTLSERDDGTGTTGIDWSPVDPNLPEFDLSQFVEEDDSHGLEGEK